MKYFMKYFRAKNFMKFYITSYRSLKVIETGAIQKLGCSFLFAFYSNYGAILYRLRDIATFWQKIAKFLYPTCI